MFRNGQPSFDDRTEARARIEIRDGVARVFQGDVGTMTEVMPKKLLLTCAGSRREIAGHDSGDTWPHKEWSERVSYALDLQGDGSLSVRYERLGDMIVDHGLSGETYKFERHGTGVLSPSGQ